ncbi:MAG TPA: ethanolamine ammonia-lyase subunit EutC [Aliidongia sp.]|uniref:ethanolamine ammonia-lyase subunit EutC n=1 Tax=Aliidongia sp. TaxID=1914230 RepID=UPI002DDD16C7|nr:ethanolamine ammonia-lyase subunit EutC [Aliidongia sp.]HEV2677835.1 ethanolamine ammonia-lyase subunit EutC [Aliidongia sp.]
MTSPTRDPWAKLRQATPARIGLGHAGPGQPTRALLAFQAAHAAARDAVLTRPDFDGLETRLAALLPVRRVASQAADRATYLTRPDLGRRLSDASAAALAGEKTGADLLIIVGDGLSAAAIERQAVPVVAALIARLPGWRLAPLLLAEGARVALGDAAAAILDPTLVLMLIGERPGLSSPDSLGAYLTWRPRPGTVDAARNCVSNIHGAGLTPDAAAQRLAWLLTEARALNLTGVGLKDAAPALSAPDGPP